MQLVEWHGGKMCWCKIHPCFITYSFKCLFYRPLLVNNNLRAFWDEQQIDTLSYPRTLTCPWILYNSLFQKPLFKTPPWCKLSIKYEKNIDVHYVYFYLLLFLVFRVQEIRCMHNEFWFPKQVLKWQKKKLFYNKQTKKEPSIISDWLDSLLWS